MLSLSRKTDYALVALAHLAQAAGGEPISARALAEAYALPQALLANLLKQLHQAGLIHSSRGTRGGYQLALEPAQISLGQVIEVIEEGPVQVALCCAEAEAENEAGDDEPCTICRIQQQCPISGSIQQLNAYFAAIFAGLTLQDLLAGRVSQAMRDALASSEEDRPLPIAHEP